MQRFATMLMRSVLLIGYAAFFHWYGSGRDPIDREEVTRLLEASGAELQTKDFEEGGFLERLSRSKDDGGSFLMLNLVKYREQPHYPDASLKPDWVRTGADADAYYGTTFLPLLAKRASHPLLLFGATWPAVLVPQGYTDVNWDYVALVRYRSRRDLVEAVCEANSLLGPRQLSWQQLKHSGVEQTLVIPIPCVGISHAIRILVGLLLLLVTRCFFC